MPKIDPVKTTTLDRMVGWFSPAAALRRLQARRTMQFLAAYDAATAGRRSGSLGRAGSTSANTELRRAGRTLRDRSRDLHRNNPYGRRAVNALAYHVVGAGIRASLPKGSVRDEWLSWAESTDCDANGRQTLYGLQNLIMRTMVMSGEAIIRRRIRRLGDGMRVPLQIQVLEPDYIDSTREGTIDGRNVVQGVAFDAIGREVGAYMFRDHPGDYNLSTLRGTYESVFVPASEYERVFYEERPGQVRGAPLLAPVMLRIADLDDYNDAQLLRQKLAAMFVAFVYDATGEVTPSTSTTETPVDTWQPGSVETLPPGKDVKFTDPPKVDGFADFRRGMLQDIATGLGIPYEALTADYSNVNYSSARLAFLEYWRLIDDLQWNLVIPRACTRIGRWWSMAAGLSGVVRMNEAPGFELSAWMPPAREMIEPSRDVPATIKAIRGGLTTLSAEIARSGYEPDDVIEKWAEDAARLDELGLQLDSDPRRVSQQGLTQARQTTGDGSLDFPDSAEGE